jgi:hypothetical protein
VAENAQQEKDGVSDRLLRRDASTVQLQVLEATTSSRSLHGPAVPGLDGEPAQKMDGG